MKERYLVSGASGFIGSHLEQRLAGQQTERLKRTDNPEEIIGLFRPDFIYHLAAYGNHSSQQDVRETYRANVLRLLDICEAVKGRTIKGVVNVGSSSEYGFNREPMKETNNLRPETFYASSKAAGTLMAEVYAKRLGVPIVTVRPFSVYGYGEADFRFIPTVIRNLYKDQYINLDPYPVHDWVEVSDFIEGMLLVGSKAQELKGKVVNIGTGIQTSNRQIVDMIARIMGRKPKINPWLGMRSYDSMNWRADNYVLKSLGWKQEHTLEEGLTKTIEGYLKDLKNGK